MQEYSVVLKQLKLLEVFKIIVPSPAMIRRGVEICNAYQVSFWDAGVRVTNPFAPDFN
jgi:predicted nucleic acid-binding protein